MKRNAVRAVLAIALAWSAGAAQGGVAATAATDAVRDERDAFADLPAPWRDYFLQARRADALEDRLARCLAYPDLPGTAWPAGYGEAHCRYHFDDPLPMREIARYVDAGDIAALEERIRAVYARHREPAGEGVHTVFDNFMEAPQADGDDPLRIARRWVELAPRSGYAALALAEVWRGRGWQARGTAVVSRTAPEALRSMEAFHAQAVAEFRRAVALQPDLIDGYIGLVDIGKSNGDDTEAAFEKARALDPGCGELAFRRMAGLEPRWGGSRMDLVAYAAQLKPLVAARPLLANQQSSPISDYVDAAPDDQRYTPAVLDLIDRAVELSGEEQGLRQAADARLTIEGDRRDPVRAYAEMLQLGRFNQRSAWADGELGRFLVGRDPAWAVRLLQRGLASAPDSAYLHYMLGAAAANTGDFALAQAHYLRAADDAGLSRAALRELSEMWLTGAKLARTAAAARATPFIDRLLAAHPGDGRGLFMRMVARSWNDRNHAVDMKELRYFLAHADLDDPWQKAHYDEIRRGMGASAPAARAGAEGARR